MAFTVPSPVAGASIVINSITDTVLCARDSFSISYHATGTFNAGNIFNVQLSNPDGTFTATPSIIGSFTGTGNNIINTKLPAHLTDGTGYKLRIVSTNPVITGIPGNGTLTIHDRPVAKLLQV